MASGERTRPNPELSPEEGAEMITGVGAGVMGGWSLEPESQDDLDARIESVEEWSSDARGAGTWHFPVIQLDVASEWAIAGVTFRPKGWLAKNVIELGASEHLREALARLDCATVDVYAESQDASRARARDAVGLLRYYQRYLRAYTTGQGSRFGLTDEVFVNPTCLFGRRMAASYLTRSASWAAMGISSSARATSTTSTTRRA